MLSQMQDATNRDALIAYEMADFAPSMRAFTGAVDETYAAALRVVQSIDARLEAGYHYRAVDGRLLATLDEVIGAILDGGLKVKVN